MRISNVKKIIRFSLIYGGSRALNKSIGRLRSPILKKLYYPLSSRSRKVSLIGCGQFAFSCISYFLAKEKGQVFLDCFDINEKNRDSLARYYGANSVKNVNKLLSNPDLDIIYIATNHSTHTQYAIQAMESGVKKIQIEKPVSTTYEQFVELIANQQKYNATLYSGYNRPNSSAIQFLKKRVRVKKEGSFSINFFISGHLLPNDHWYRNYEEGTRICGNMGHWLDLSIHILSWRELPELLNIQVAYSDKEESDDNITINLTSEKGDLISMMLTSRTEPFEGINETINFQYQDTIAKIDDFRKMIIWQNSKLIRKRFFPKDVGHKRTILQPFYMDKENRDWKEVIISTLLMLHITDLVRNQQKDSVFEIQESLRRLEKDISNFKF